MENKRASKCKNFYLAAITATIKPDTHGFVCSFVVVVVVLLLKKITILKMSLGTNHCLPDENNFISLAEKAFYYDHIPPQCSTESQSGDTVHALCKVNLKEARDCRLY